MLKCHKEQARGVKFEVKMFEIVSPDKLVVRGPAVDLADKDILQHTPGVIKYHSTTTTTCAMRSTTKYQNEESQDVVENQYLQSGNENMKARESVKKSDKIVPKTDPNPHKKGIYKTIL